MACPAANVGAVQVMVPPLPAGGAEQVPAEVVRELKGNPAGRVAVNITAFAGAFCAFLICHVMESVVVAPDVGPPFCGEPVTCRSVVVGGAVMAVFKLAVLFTGDGSASGLPPASFATTVTVFVIDEVRFRTTVTVALLFTVMPPMLHWNCEPRRAQAPWLGVPETNVAPAGTKSVTVTCGAKLGPRFVAVRM